MLLLSVRPQSVRLEGCDFFGWKSHIFPDSGDMHQAHSSSRIDLVFLDPATEGNDGSIWTSAHEDYGLHWVRDKQLEINLLRSINLVIHNQICCHIKPDSFSQPDDFIPGLVKDGTEAPCLIQRQPATEHGSHASLMALHFDRSANLCDTFYQRHQPRAFRFCTEYTRS